MARSAANPAVQADGSGAQSRVRDLEPLFAPKSIAVIGASRTPGTVGSAIPSNLILGGYTGVVYPVNPKAKSIMGARCVPSISAIDDHVDLAVIILPAPAVEKAVLEAADHGTKHLVIISAGFKEVGEEGAQRERRIKAIADERGLSIIGPNCLGVINTAPDVRMNASFGRDMPRPGRIGLISQSGALCTALLDYAKGHHLGFSRFISFGNKCDVTEVDLLRCLASDRNTDIIMMYVEDISDGQAFVNAAYEITHGSNPKPILAMKTGRTAQGAAAAASHTGSLAGSDEVYDAIMSQAGVIRVNSVEDLFNFAPVFLDNRMPAGNQTAIVTNAGGPGIMATDACIRNGMELAKFGEYTLKSLKFQMPPAANIKNPVDVIGDAKHDRYRSALDAVTADANVHQIVVIVTPQTMTDVVEIAEVVGEAKEFCDKPIVACFMGAVDVSPGVELLRKHDVPVYMFPEDAMQALAVRERFARWTRSPSLGYKHFDVQAEAVDAIFAEELAAGRNQLVEVKALAVFEKYGFPIVPYSLARTADEAVEAARRMEFPVVLKIAGPKILHKTDVGGVKLNLTNDDEVRTGFNNMIATVKERMGADVEIWGVLVQKMLPKGKEIILGMTRDPRFGPLLMFGLGGIYTEALRDVAFRLAPIRENVAGEMIKDIRSYRLLEGVRGERPSDMAAIADCLLRLSQLVTSHPQIKELDINPLMVYPRGQGAMVADARVILSE
ncbi:MAG TPA: acetate--CoA ligase family protein [Phycisphaerae bacterium]|nr:acetate--CoA ligase family protein [Phycisphaerae bacterium]HOJ73631.1 acetate--CoA ligase family protein [Phycisphaerae bacterium]HOM50278.1 acetate--CoA ligase family protein [Phycisphaerae bacterium]HON68141.1 acetate--CoA ligase family protein [Phycisphaerae bacterium]HOQ84880.1 acetate--CoA ligase family protein [Phycisphaerae bacterium]